MKQIIKFSGILLCFTMWYAKVNAENSLAVNFSEAGTNDIALVANSIAAPVYYDSNDAIVVETAATMFAEDVELVSGIKPVVSSNIETSDYAVIAGTLGSNLIDGIVSSGKISSVGIDGQWETFRISVVDQPVEGISHAVVVCGSDPRATAYGLLELSRMMGVSPFVWWADVTPEHHDVITVVNGQSVFGPPSVKYRGIFINDEDWGLAPWAKKKMDSDKNEVGPRTYERVFQLLLRMKANYLWPAMHGCSRAFWYYAESPELARKYDIVMGSSHCEQMLRNNVDEWKTNTMGEWNWKTNSASIINYWTQRVNESKNNDAIYTLGMRGIHDSGMPGYDNLTDKVEATKAIISKQREILEEQLGKSANTVPQLFCPYKEALDIYRGGIDLPDDVTLLWADDNYSYIRQLSDPTEQLRSGGGGVYYHFSYWGPPQCWLWLASTPPALTYYEMMKAYTLNCKNVWVFNVGDIKPQELETQFAMDFAWDVNSINQNNPNSYLLKWAKETFGEAVANEVYSIKKEYYRLVNYGKPEFEINIDYSNTEMLERMQSYEALANRVDALRGNIRSELQDAYFQLMEYPIKAAAAMNAKVMGANLSYYYAQHGNATESTAMGQLSKSAFTQIVSLTNTYNTTLANGKWDGMMSYKPLGESKFDVLPVATAEDLKDELFSSDITRKTTYIPAGEYESVQGSSDFQIITGLGDKSSALTIWPLNMSQYSDASSAPYATYSLAAKKGTNTIEIHCLPSFPLYQGLDLRYAISIDGGAFQTQSIKQEAETWNGWNLNVVRGYTSNEYTYIADEDKDINVNIYFLDPGLVLSSLKLTNSSSEDLTDQLQNPDFEYKAAGELNDGTTVRGCPYGWSYEGVFKGNSWGINRDGSNYSGQNLCWINSSPFPSDFRLYQEVEGLESGIYKLTCRLCVPGQYNNVRLFANEFVTYFGKESDYPNNLTEGEINSFAGYTDHNYTLKEISVQFVISNGEILKLGIATSNIHGDGTLATNNDGWFKVDDFRLEFVGELQDTELKDKLQTLFIKATNLYETTEAGTENGQYGETARNEFKAAIDEASILLTDEHVSTAELVSSYYKLSDAMKAYKASKVHHDPETDLLAVENEYWNLKNGATYNSQTGLLQNGNPGWYFDVPQDLSDYRYLCINTARNARNQSSSVFMTDASGNSISGEEYKKYNNKDYTLLPSDLKGGKMWFDTWNNQRIIIIDLQWVANNDKNGDGSACKYVDIERVASIGINTGSTGVYIGNAWLTNTMPKYSSWGDNADYTLKTSDNNFSEGDIKTICLPYSAVCSGADIYEIVDLTSNGIELARVNTVMEAGKAYFFYKTAATIHDGNTVDSNDGVYFFRVGPTTVDSPINNNGLIGTFSSIQAPQGNDYRVLSNNKLYIVDQAVNVGANKAYIDITQIESKTSDSKQRIKLIFDEATGIESITSSEQFNHSKVYDLSGRSLNNIPSKGIYIINGKKTIRQ